MRSWRDVLINGSQSSKACGKDEERVKINNSYNPITLLPVDPFEMNKVPEDNADRRIFGESESWIGHSTDYCTVRGGVSIEGSAYQQIKSLLSSFEAHVNYGDDFNNIGSSGLVPDLTGAGNLGTFAAAKEAPILEREMAELVLHHIEDESLANLEHIKKDLVLGMNFPGYVIDLVGNQSFGPSDDEEDILYTGRRHVELFDGDVNYPLLWRCIHIDPSLGEKITDDDLYRLTQSAQGNMQCLILPYCPKITDVGIKRVMESNPTLKKINVPGFIWLATSELINNLKSSECSGQPGINSLELSRDLIDPVEDFKEPNFLVDANKHFQEESPNLHCLHDDHCRENCAYVEGCADDFEKLSLVGILLNKSPKLYFFHDENCRCKEIDSGQVSCACIERCDACGGCIKNYEYIDTFTFENIFKDCTNNTNKV